LVVLCKLSGGGGGGGGGQVEDLVGVVGVDYVGIGRFGGVAASVVASGGRVDSGRSAGGCRGCGGRCRRLGHDFLADLADLQLQARFRGEDLRVQRLEEAGGLGGWKESVFLEELHDQLPALIQDPAEGRKILL